MKIGDKILCINDKGHRPYVSELNLQTPKLGEIYTIRGTRNYKGLGFTLEEVNNPILKYTDGICEPHWRSERFILWNPEEEMIELLKNKEKQKN
jgi:hypothetical protein